MAHIDPHLLPPRAASCCRCHCSTSAIVTTAPPPPSPPPLHLPPTRRRLPRISDKRLLSQTENHHARLPPQAMEARSHSSRSRSLPSVRFAILPWPLPYPVPPSLPGAPHALVTSADFDGAVFAKAANGPPPTLLIDGDLAAGAVTRTSVFALDCVPLWRLESVCGRRPEMGDAATVVRQPSSPSSMALLPEDPNARILFRCLHSMCHLATQQPEACRALLLISLSICYFMPLNCLTKCLSQVTP